jgi:hypothetical protein
MSPVLNRRVYDLEGCYLPPHIHTPLAYGATVWSREVRLSALITMSRPHTRSLSEATAEPAALSSAVESLSINSSNPLTATATPAVVAPRAPSPNPFLIDSSTNVASESKSEADSHINDFVEMLKGRPIGPIEMEDAQIRVAVADVLYHYYPVQGKRKKSEEITIHSTITGTPSKPDDRGGGSKSSNARLDDWLRSVGMDYCPVSGERRGDRTHVLLPACFREKQDKAVCFNLLASS